MTAEPTPSDARPGPVACCAFVIKQLRFEGYHAYADRIQDLIDELALAQSRLAEVEKLLAEAFPRIGRFIVITTDPPIKLPPDTLAERIEAALKRSSVSSPS